MLLALLGIGAYVTYTLNLWGPMIRMANAASQQALEIAKERLREFVESSETGQRAQAMAMSGRGGAANGRVRGRNSIEADDDDDDEDDIPMEKLDREGRRPGKSSTNASTTALDRDDGGDE